MLVQAAEKPSGSGAINNALAQAAIWQFYYTDPERVIVKVGGFLKIRVKDLHVLFELLAGTDPRS